MQGQEIKIFTLQLKITLKYEFEVTYPKWYTVSENDPYITCPKRQEFQADSVVG